MTSASGAVHALRDSSRKFVWCARQVGLRQTARGIVRFGGISIRRAATAHVRTDRRGLDVHYRYPSQMIPTLVLFGELLEPEQTILDRVLGPGSLAVDVGAAIGTWTISAARTGARVHACEPDPDNLSSLETNIRVNGLEDLVSVSAVALGRASGRGRLSRAGNRYVTRITAAQGDDEGDMPVMSLTEFADLQGLDQIDVLKVNTAGAEAEVLAGGRSLFEQRRVRLAMFLDGLVVRPKLDELRDLSYDVGFIGPNTRFVPLPSADGSGTAWKGPMTHYLVVRRYDVQI